MAVRLEPVTEQNWADCIELKVAEGQKRYVASNLYSIAQAQFYPGLKPCCIYDGATMVGFVMYGPGDDDPSQRMVWRMMIDSRHQRRGHGTAAMALVIADERARGTAELYLSTEPHNTDAIRFYQKLGFVDTGILNEDEEVFVLTL